jgi:hypothetical protein
MTFYIKGRFCEPMSGSNSASLYGPAAPLLQNGATAHVSPYSQTGPMPALAFSRDTQGRFTGR